MDKKEIQYIKTKEKQQIAHNVFHFIHNFPVDFIEEIWSGWLADHLSQKFKRLCERDGYGSANAVCGFYAALDSSNQRKLIDFIFKTHVDR